jgi:hypothetical protein
MLLIANHLLTNGNSFTGLITHMYTSVVFSPVEMAVYQTWKLTRSEDVGRVTHFRLCCQCESKIIGTREWGATLLMVLVPSKMMISR